MSKGSATSLPQLVGFLARHAAIGFLLGAAAAGAVIGSNLGGITDLMRQAGLGAVPSLMLTAAFGLTFASLQMGFAVMLLPRSDELPFEAGDPD